MELTNLTFAYIMQALAVIIILYEAYKKIMEIKKTSDEGHDRQQKWDNAANVLKEKEKKWDEGMYNAEMERKKIVERYDARLDEQDAKIQQLLSMLCMCLRAQDAILEALVEKAGGIIAGRMAVLAEGDAQNREDLIYLEKLPLFNPDGTIME